MQPDTVASVRFVMTGCTMCAASYSIRAIAAQAPWLQCVLYTSSAAFMNYNERNFNIQVNVHN